jgi:hypothetical protein
VGRNVRLLAHSLVLSPQTVQRGSRDRSNDESEELVMHRSLS